jgi:hypothetical protein
MTTLIAVQLGRPASLFQSAFEESLEPTQIRLVGFAHGTRHDRSRNPAALPKPGATITAIDFGFRAPIKLHDGELVRFANGGFLVHQIQGIGVKNAKAAMRLTALLLAGNDNRAQKVGTSFPEFAGPLSPGAIQQELINEAPGVYLLVCIMRTQRTRASSPPTHPDGAKPALEKHPRLSVKAALSPPCRARATRPHHSRT